MFNNTKGHGSIRKLRTGAVVAILTLSFTGFTVTAEETNTITKYSTSATETSTEISVAETEDSIISETPSTEIPQSQGIIPVQPNEDGTYAMTEPFYVGEDVPQSQGIVHVSPNGDGTYNMTEPQPVEKPAELVTPEQVTQAKSDVDEAQIKVDDQQKIVDDANTNVKDKQKDVEDANKVSPNTVVTDEQLAKSSDDVKLYQGKVEDATKNLQSTQQAVTPIADELTKSEQSLNTAKEEEQKAQKVLDDANKTLEDLNKKASDIKGILGQNAPSTSAGAKSQMQDAVKLLDVHKNAVQFAKDQLVKAKELDASKEELVRLEKALEDAIKKAQPVEMVSHRGYNRKYPESSNASYIGAYNDGFRSYEADVRFTKDGIPVVHHDATINAVARNTDGTRIEGNKFIRDMTLAELNAYDYGISRGAEFLGTEIQTLRTLMETFASKADNVRLQLELKENNTDDEKQMMYVMAKEVGILNKIQWIAFNWENLNYFVNKDAQASVALLAANDSQALTDKAKSFQNGQRNVSVSINFPNLTQESIDKYVKAGIPVYIWTTDHESTVTRFGDTGIQGIVTNSGTSLFNILVTKEEQKQIDDLKLSIANLKKEIATNPVKTVSKAESDLKAKEAELSALNTRISNLNMAEGILLSKENAEKSVSLAKDAYKLKREVLDTISGKVSILKEEHENATKRLKLAQSALTREKQAYANILANYEGLKAYYANQQLSAKELETKKAKAEEALKQAEAEYENALAILSELKVVLTAKTEIYEALLAKLNTDKHDTPKDDTTKDDDNKGGHYVQEPIFVPNPVPMPGGGGDDVDDTEKPDFSNAKPIDNGVVIDEEEDITVKDIQNATPISNSIEIEEQDTQIATPMNSASPVVYNSVGNAQLPKTNSDAGLFLCALGWVSLAGLAFKARKRK